MKKLLILLFMSITLIAEIEAQKKTADPNKYLFVGTYTGKGSEGIYVLKFNTKTGDFKAVSNTKGITNPSFLDFSPNKKFVYSVNESGNLGGISAFSFDQKTGELKLLNSSSANGDHPCHLSMNADGKHLATANYSGGNLCLFEINVDGSLKTNPQVIQHLGSGPKKDRQEKPHVHSVNWAPNQKDLYAVDLGTDKIMHYKLENGKLITGNPEFTQVLFGSGPRHFTFTPNGKYAYVIQELNNGITTFRHDNGFLKPIDGSPTLPADYMGENSTADIHVSPDGKFLYGSNRGHNSITIYSINQMDGKLQMIDNQSVLGKTPRNFMIDPTGNFLLAANQDSDNIVIFKRNKTTGKLTPTGKEIKVSMPVCLKMM
jgi:6-phosphogluconolactonase